MSTPKKFVIGTAIAGHLRHRQAIDNAWEARYPNGSDDVTSLHKYDEEQVDVNEELSRSAS